MYKRILILCTIMVLLVACSEKELLTEEKFKSLHKSIYDAWELESEDEIRSLLDSVLTDPFYEEQLSTQLAMLKARQDAKEKHKVETITYQKLEIVESSEIEATVYTDYTIEGYRFHGDYHEQKSSHRIYWHLVYTKDGWKIDQTDT